MSHRKLVQYLVKGEWHFLQMILSIISYKYKRELMDITSLEKLRGSFYILYNRFYIRTYNPYTYNSRKIKTKLPNINSYLCMMLYNERLPNQYLNFIKCYYNQPYPPIVLSSVNKIRISNVLFTYNGDDVVYDYESRSYVYRDKEYKFLSEIIP